MRPTEFFITTKVYSKGSQTPITVKERQFYNIKGQKYDPIDI